MRESRLLGQVTPSRPFSASSFIGGASRPSFGIVQPTKLLPPCECDRWSQHPHDASAYSSCRGGEVLRSNSMMSPARSPCRPASCDVGEETSQAAVRPRRYSSLRNAAAAAAANESPFNISLRSNRPLPSPLPQSSPPVVTGQSCREELHRRPNIEFNAAAAMKDGTFSRFLQKEISVITYQNIRYEGKLWSIDTANSTIEVQNVRNMGTEQRAASIKIPPASDFYRFIVFNVDLIKSVQPVTRVDGSGDHHSTPTPVISTPVKGVAKINDGRCMSVSSGGAYALPKSNGSPGYTTSTPIVKKIVDACQGDGELLRSIDVRRLVADDRAICRRDGGHQHPVPHYYQQPQQAHHKVSDNINGCNNGVRLKNIKNHVRKDRDTGKRTSYCSGSNSSSSYATCPADNKERLLKPSNETNASRGLMEQKANKDKALAVSRVQKDEKGTRHVSFMSSDQIPENRPQSRRITHIPQVPRCFMNNHGGRGNPHPGRSNRLRHERGPSPHAKVPTPPRRPRPGLHFRSGEFARPKMTVKFQDEFDFDKALEEFKELTLDESKSQPANSIQANSETTNGDSTELTNGISDPPAKECYNREKCFYDNLSSTNISDGNLRRSRKEEIMVNKETFGVSWIPTRRRYFSVYSTFHGNFSGRRFYGGGHNFSRRSNGNH